MDIIKICYYFNLDLAEKCGMCVVAETHASILPKITGNGKGLKNSLPLSLESFSPKRSQSLSVGFGKSKIISL